MSPITAPSMCSPYPTLPPAKWNTSLPPPSDISARLLATLRTMPTSATSPAVAEATPATSGTPTATRQYLYGVQGLRTVAALMVAVYHIWFHRVSGGVDVFFVVAGFFAAGSLLPLARTASPAQRARMLRDYLLRTARRVIPSAAVVVLATVAASTLWMPKTFWAAGIEHARQALLFQENLHLIRVSADYLQSGLDASPFQQFWALGVQVQSYVFFALLTFVAASAAWLVGGRRASSKTAPRAAVKTVVAASATVFVLSFAWSIYQTQVNQPAAYFAFPTRVWEFLAGTLLAVALARITVPTRVARAAGWLGLLAILGFAAVADLSALLPGFVALVPVVAASGVIIASKTRAEPAVLTWRPILWFADASFAFYLWHWPLLVFYRWRIDESVSLLGGLAILLLSGILAVATTKLLEDPFRKSVLLRAHPLLSLLASVALLAPPFVATEAWQRELTQVQIADTQAVADLADGKVPPSGPVPSPLVAKWDIAPVYGAGCHQTPEDPELLECVWGQDQSRKQTIVVAGGSHEAQWLDVAIETADAVGATVVSYTKSGCPFGDNSSSPENPHPSCAVWSQALLDQLLTDPPDVVVAVATREEGGWETFPDWKRNYFEELTASGIPVVAIRDNPRFPRDMAACTEFNQANCSRQAQDFFAPESDLALPQDDLFAFVDLVDAYCPDGECQATQTAALPAGEAQVLVYRDDNHLTRTWTLLNGGPVARAIRAALSS